MPFRYKRAPLDDDEESSLPFLHSRQKAPNKFTTWCRTHFPWILNIFLGSAVLYLLLVPERGETDSTSNFVETYSPARHVVELQNVVFTNGFPGKGKSIYQGPPEPARDKAWEELYNFGISRIPFDSAKQLVNKTLPIPEDPGHFVVSLSVFHQLHCLNMVRKRVWATEQASPDAELMGIEHISHCIDAIRQSLMCSSDITPLPWVWDEQSGEAKELADVQHTCRNFEKIKQWGKENKAKHFRKEKIRKEDLVDWAKVS